MNRIHVATALVSWCFLSFSFGCDTEESVSLEVASQTPANEGITIETLSEAQRVESEERTNETEESPVADIPTDSEVETAEAWEVPEELLPNERWSASCSNLEVAEAELCAEANFWPAFQDEMDDREATFERLTTVIDEHEGSLSARLYFLRALLGVAIQTENSGVDSLITPYILTMKPDLDKACELEPENPFYNTWRLSGDLILAMMLKEEELYEQAKAESFEHALADFKNVMGIMSTWMAFPLDSGLPQEALPYMEEWLANGHLDEVDDAWYRPYTRIGFTLMVGDMYARMGEKEKAREYVEKTLVHPDAESWPYLFLADDLNENLDTIVEGYLALPDDIPATEQMISWGRYSCRMCHSNVDAPDAP